ncbi:LysR family transcriptional regulator [Paucibacter sp. B2R-40]|uniref:LysR family transcriptional regulator n=1 Tax=Paucibacter sp. B2R-40 TaxID=2893554 RepID=UPI0021E434F0|nr:LysR family transcriptional regulator [Paucibacter sp. B2R-40]MCV2357028.1 LysR family transcriptional regulator [Paucibacter sp. B2R-40]
MDPLERLQVFHRVAELASFTQAALSLGLPKASASSAVQQLESQLGARLLHRTTRRVQLTQDGQAFYERSKDVLADMEELQAMFAQQPGAAGLSGRVRVDMSTAIARNFVIPRLPELLQAHPLLALEISSTERRVDLVREGFDCVLRVGSVVDASLIARPLGLLRMVNCASPAYLARHGVPLSLADLADPAQDHRLVHFVSILGAKPGGFDYLDETGQPRSLGLPGSVTVNNADAYQAACLAGLGLIQVPVTGVRDALLRDALQSGSLVEVLPEFTAPAMPINLLYANRRNLSRRVRVVMDWLAGVIADAQLDS